MDDLFTSVEPGDQDALALACESAAGRLLISVDESSDVDQKMNASLCQATALCYLIQKMNANPANWPLKIRKMAFAQLKSHYGKEYVPTGDLLVQR